MKQYGRASLRRCLAVLFAALMVFSVLPLTAMAEGIEGLSDNTARAAVGGDAEALAIGGEERSNAATVYYKPATSIDTSKQYLITTKDNGTVYAMTSEYFDSSGGLQAVSLTADSNGYIQASANTAIDNTCLWTFSTTSGGTIKNAETNTYLANASYYLILSDSGATFSYNSNALSLSNGGSYPDIAFFSSYKCFDFSSSAATITLYERVVAAESVEVNPPVHAMAPNATKQLTAVVYPTNAANKNVTWTSNNNDIATVDGTGLVTANAVGTATITATTEDGHYTDTCVVTVTNNATKEVTMFVNTLHAVPNEDYLIGYTTNGDTYIMSNEVSNTNYLKAAEATKTTVGDVCRITDSTACITALSDGSEIPTTHQWYFGADADLYFTTIQNRENNNYLQRAEGSNATTYVGLSTAQGSTTDGTQSWARGTTSDGDVTFIYYSSSSTSYHFVAFDTENSCFGTYYNTIGKGGTVDLYVKRTVTVVDPTSTEPGVTIEPAELTVLPNDSGTLTATAVNIPESASYEWTSDSESVAVAPAAGNPSTATVTGVATGTATITCTVTYNEGGAPQTLTATAVVNVVASIQVASITVPSEIRLELDKGTVITPVVVTAPEGGEYGTDYTIEYVCDNESVADITANGGVFTVTAKSTGTVTVTFIAVNSQDNTQRVSGSTVITVKEADSIPAPETGEGGGEKPIYKKVYVLVDDVEKADGNYIIATSSSAGTAGALYDDGTDYVQRGSVTIKSGSTDIYGAHGKYIELNDDSYVWGWRYNSTDSEYGRYGTVWNVGTGKGLYATGSSSNNYLNATVDSSALYWYSAPSSSAAPAAHYITSPVYNNYSPNRYYLGYNSSTYPYMWFDSSYYNPTPGDQFYFYKEMIVQTGAEHVDSGVEIYLDGEKISQKEKAIEGVVQGQESNVTLTGTPVNIPAGATGSAVWKLTKTDGAIKSVDRSSGVVTLAGSLGYGIIEVTYTYTYGGKTYTVKNYTKLVVSSFKPMTGTGETVTKRTIYKLVDSLTDGNNYIIVNGSSDAGTRQALKPGGDNSTLFSGTYTPPNGGTASPYTAYIVGDGEVVVKAPDPVVSDVSYIETDDSNVVWRYSVADSSTANYGYFTNVGTARKLTYDEDLEGYKPDYIMLTADDTFSNAWYYRNNKIYRLDGSYYAGIGTNKVLGGGYKLYTSYTSTSSYFRNFYIFEETEIETVSTAEVSVDIYDGSKLVSGGVVSVNDTSSTLPLTAQTNYKGTDGQTAWSIISGANIASIDQNGVVTFAANTSGKVLVKVTFTFDNNGQTQMATNYVTLDVRSGGQLTDTSDRDNFPEYPNEGSVRIEKTADADETEFAKTGVGTVELFVRGVPVQSKGVDVVLVVDTSGSMKDGLTGAAATSGNDKMSIAKAAAIDFANTLLTVTNPDGTISYTDNRLAVVSFASDAAVLTGKSPLVADSRALVSVNSSSDMSSITTAINSMSATGGTNYDAAFKTAYDILRDAQEQGGDRKQYVVFVTDGAPGIYNNAELDSTTFPKAGTYYTTTEIETMSAQWYNWTQGVEPVWENMPADAKNNFTEYAYADNIYAAAIKGTTFAGSNFKDSWKTDLDITAMLGAGIYGISLGMKGGSQIIGVTTNSSGAEDWAEFTSAQCTNLINRLCNKDIFAADSTAELTAAFEKIGKEVLQAGTNATVRDTIGADYDLQIEPFNYIDTAHPRETNFESSIEVRKYTVDANGNRTGAYETIEKVTFNADGTEAYSTLKTGNIMTMTLDGKNYTITAENFTYTSSDKRFVWKFDTIISDDMAIRFNVYLTGTREGSREGGLYDTNSWANLTYTNYLGTDCRLTFEKPALPWQNARVTYKFFLVDESGRPVNKDGVLVNYANLTYVGTEKTIKLGDAAFVPMSGADGHYSVELSAEALKALQSELSTYALYDKSAAVTIHTDTTGTWGGYSITKGKTPDTTAVWPKPGADAKFDNADDAVGNFTNVTVAFAVVFNVKLIPDAVVIDFGLPVDINVMQNDLVSQVNGQLYGLTQDTDAVPDFASAYTPSDATVTTVGEKLNLTYGHATIQNDTTVRYTPGSMQMSQPEVFGYEVITGTSEVNGTITTKYIRSTVTVIPATTIYYEDNFSNSDGTSYITYNNGVSEWKLVGEGVSGTVVQDTDYVGSGNNYGYDSHYDNCATFSLDQAHKVTVTKAQYESIRADSTKTWPTASFRFTGTGFDVISLTNAATGMIMVQVKDTDGKIVKSVFVDTYYSGVEVNGNLYQIPVINIYDLPHGTYDVTITVPYLEMFDHTGIDGKPSGSYDMYIDGIRIYNPAGDNAAAHGAHTEDDEAFPYVQELRNMMIAAASGGQPSGPVFVDGNATADANAYQSAGPNNEVYLAHGQSIVFALQTVGKTKPAGVYVSMKSPTGEVKVRYGSAAEAVSESTGLKYEERNMVTTSDMYYEIPENVLSWEQQADGTWKTKVAVQIANSGTPGQGQILALTNLKVTYASAPTDNNGEVIFTTTQQQSQVAYTQIRDLMAELYADSYDTEIRSAAFATRTIDVNKTTELNVVTSTDANALIIRDKKGNVITPESISYEDKDGERHWKLTMTHKVSGIYIYKVSVEAAYGIMTDTPATVVAYVVPRSVVRPKPSMPKPPLFGWM